MTTLFISDLHLDPATPKITAIFCDFITRQAQQADALYILGDLFEYWIGDDDTNDLSVQVCQALRSLTQHNIPVYLMHGNRDFLLGQRFASRCGLTLIADPTLINLYGRRTLLMHGDTLCTNDAGYQRFRKIIRHPLLTTLFLKMPLRLRQQCAQFLRSKSESQTANKTQDIMDVTPAAVIKTMEEQQVDLLIHGHTHRGAIHEVTVLGNPAQRIVLDAWHERGNVLLCDATGQLRSETLLCNA